MINKDQLARILLYRDYDDRTIETLTASLVNTCERYDINTSLRVCHFLAQVIHESGGFFYDREIWGPTKTQKGYEGRKDLGNTEPGDGYRFRGRGYIQLTGRFNYRKAGRDLGVNFEANPELVAESPWNMIVAGWYWDLRVLNNYADKDSLLNVTVRINGGFNGLKDREKWLDKCKSIIL